MSRISNQSTWPSTLVLIVILIWLPRAIGEDPASRPATSQQSTSSPESTSQPTDREIELREGRRIIKETAAVYKNCKSYQDEGETIRGDDINHDGNLIFQSLWFKTSFVRPGRCRFEYRDFCAGPSHYIGSVQFVVWANDRDVRTWRRNPPYEDKLEDIAVGFAGTWWMSGGNPFVVPALLMPDKLGEFSLTTLKNIRFAGKERSNGATFDLVDADDGPLVNYRIWINADTKLVHKIFERHKFPSWPTERTTTYNPKIDIDIPAKNLEFNPPHK